jgi:F-type H+-transporting ATPase subunit b
MVNFAIILFILWKFAYRPVLKILEERRQRVAEAMINAQKAREELARTEAQRQEVLAETNAQANKLIEEARAAAAKVREEETQKAIKEAEQIVSKAREAAALEHARMLADVKRELGRLVVATTSKVTGKVLTQDDQRRLNEETTRALAE